MVVSLGAILGLSARPKALFAAPPERAAIGGWGLDLAGMDRTVRPGDDFFRYGAGGWLRATEIPPDRAAWGPFYALRAKAEADVRTLVEALLREPPPPGTVERKIADFYAAYVDTAAIEAAGLHPVETELAGIRRAGSHEDVAGLMARADLAAGGPFSIDIWADERNPDRSVVNISQGGLGLPDRDYYLRDDPSFSRALASYRTYVERVLSFAGDAVAERSAAAIVALETAIARLHWPAEKRADRDLTYNPKTRAELKALAPHFPWDVMLAVREIPSWDAFGAKQPDAIQALGALFSATPVETWRAYLTFHYLDGMAEVLPRTLGDLAFEFRGRVLSGQTRQRERWKQATAALNAALGEAVGRLYVRRYFPPSAKAGTMAIVENLRAAYGARIEAAQWLSPQARRIALRKLAKLRVKVGYPDRWRDYSTLEVRPGDPVGNLSRSRLWEWRRKAAQLGRPTDRDAWGMTPQTVNAYYNAFFNEIVFPAAILQPPYFDPRADPAVNYGGVGGVIGHEIGHAFDDQGAKSDENGVLRLWWTQADLASFRARTRRLAQQYAQYEPLPGVRLNGELTLSENIGDTTGLAVALDAYRLSRHGKAAPTIDGFKAEQRFFLSWAQTYRGKVRDAQLRKDVASDPHSPVEFRVNGVVRNLDAWYDAFDVKPGDKLYLAPQDRVRVW
jgi:putative endopeptidase